MPAEARIRAQDSDDGEVISEVMTWAWRTAGGGILGEMYNATVRRQVESRAARDDGRGAGLPAPMVDAGNPGENLIQRMNAGNYQPGDDWTFYSPQAGRVRPVKCIRREIRRPDRSSLPSPLAEAIKLPPLRPGEVDWMGETHHYSADQVLAKLEQTERAPAAPWLRTVVEYEPIDGPPMRMAAE